MEFLGLGLKFNLQTFSIKVNLIEKFLGGKKHLNERDVKVAQRLFQSLFRLFLQMLVLRCFDRFDLLVIVFPQSGHLIGVLRFA